MSFSSSMVFELIPAAPGSHPVPPLLRERRVDGRPRPLGPGRARHHGRGDRARHAGRARAGRGIRSRWRTVLEAALISARIVPSIVFAVAAYFVFSRVGHRGHHRRPDPRAQRARLPVRRRPRDAARSTALTARSRRPRRASGPGRSAPSSGSRFPRSASPSSAARSSRSTSPSTRSWSRSSSAACAARPLPVKVWDAIIYEITPDPARDLHADHPRQCRCCSRRSCCIGAARDVV